jgi:hypothetical protein
MDVDLLEVSPNAEWADSAEAVALVVWSTEVAERHSIRVPAFHRTQKTPVREINSIITDRFSGRLAHCLVNFAVVDGSEERGKEQQTRSQRCREEEHYHEKFDNN